MIDDEQNQDRSSTLAGDHQTPPAPPPMVARPPRPSPPRATPSSTRPTPTVSVPAPVMKIAFVGGPSRAVHATSDDRPTPRSTVIPRLPPPPMRPKLETLIFHGAPPVAPTTPAPLAPVSRSATKRLLLPPPLHEELFDVRSAELLPEADLEEDDDESLAWPGGGTSRTDRPPPLPGARRRADGGVIAGLVVAAGVPVALAAILFARAPQSNAVTAVATPAPVAPAPAQAARPPRPDGACIVSGESRLLSRRAVVRGGVEPAAASERVAFGALSSSKSGAAFELDPQTLAVKSTATIVGSAPMQHVVPDLWGDAPLRAEGDAAGLRAVADADGDAVFGLRDGQAVWGTGDGEETVRLWKVAGSRPIEAPRVTALGSDGERAVTFRRGGAIWIGAFRGAETTSDLMRVSHGVHVGVPALDARGGDAVVAWAERDAWSPWGIRWSRWSPSRGPGAVHELALPPGGPGDRAMAPSVAALPDGRLLLAWTEAGQGRNQVRAMVFDAADHPVGDAVLVSPGDSIAGQEAIALGDAGRGAIAYFVSRRGAFELRATAIDCGR